MAFGVVGGTMMLQGAVLGVAIREFSEGPDLVVLVELELAGFDLALHFERPIVSLLFAFEVIADGGVAFDADDRAPDGRAVVVFAFVNGCHDSNLRLTVLGWMALPVKIILRCTAIAPSAYILNFNLIFDQAESCLSAVD